MATLTAMLVAWSFAAGVEEVMARMRLHKRVKALLGPCAALPGAGQSTADPILRARSRAGDAWLVRWLPGGGAIATGLTGGRLSLSAAAGAAGAVALAAMAGAAGLGMVPVPAVAATPIIALGLLHLVARTRVRRGRAAFAKDFPDAIATIIRALHAGLPVTAAVAEVARGGSGPVARSFGTVTEAIRLGQPLETALWTAARSVNLSEFDFFVVTVALQRETGGNLAETLAGLDTTLRMRRQLTLKVRAMAAEARASAMIIGSLPFVMAALLWITSPAYLVPLFTTALGKTMLGAGLASIAIGAAIIAQLVQVRA